MTQLLIDILTGEKKSKGIFYISALLIVQIKKSLYYITQNKYSTYSKYKAFFLFKSAITLFVSKQAKAYEE